MSRNQMTLDSLTDLHRSLTQALETIPHDMTLMSRSSMTVKQFRKDAGELLGVVRSLQEACAPPRALPGSQDRRVRAGTPRRANDDWNS
jgi:hypothetical protein